MPQNQQNQNQQNQNRPNQNQTGQNRQTQTPREGREAKDHQPDRTAQHEDRARRDEDQERGAGQKRTDGAR